MTNKWSTALRNMIQRMVTGRGNGSICLLMYVERLRLIVCEVHKCINELGPSYLHNLFL